jgi:hypothetical protein
VGFAPTPKFRRSGAYMIKSADGRSQSVEPRTPSGPPVKPTAADKALVAALRKRRAR